MVELLLPGGSDRVPFDRAFFAQHFEAGEAPACELSASDADVPVVELELVNGQTCDVFHFIAFQREFLIADLFVDPPDCEDLYRSYIRYETVFRVNIRYYPAPSRRLGFEPQKVPVQRD